MTLALHNPAQLDSAELRAIPALHRARINSTTYAGLLYIRLLREATAGHCTITHRTQYAAELGCSERTLAAALTKLEAADLIETSRPAVRGSILVRVGNGPRPAARPDPQRELFEPEEPAHVAEPPALRVADVVADCPRQDARAEPAAGHVRATQETERHDLSAKAMRECATDLRDGVAVPPPRPPRATKTRAPQNAQTLNAEDLAKLYPHLHAEFDAETAQELRNSIPTPHSLSSASADIPSEAQPRNRNVERRAKAGMSNDGPLLTHLAEHIDQRVALDADYRDWMKWSFALMVVEGPLSRHDLEECIAGSHGKGDAFTGAMLARLGTRDPPVLATHTLLADDGRSAQLHRFHYLRKALRTRGVSLPREATQPAWKRNRRHDQRAPPR